MEDEYYDPKIYGRLKARFLNLVAGRSISEYAEQEHERRQLIKDIREGRLTPTKREAEGDE